MVVGHYGCGGVHAALTGERAGPGRQLAAPRRRRRRRSTRHAAGTLESDTARHARLCELNALEQAVNVCQTTIVQDAWQRGQKLGVHAWVYGLHDGRVRDLGLDANDAASLPERYAGALARLDSRS